VSSIESEIAGQPSCWRQAAEQARVAASSLPRSGARVAVVGCGTSLYMAQAYAAMREARGLGETDAFPASEYPFRRYDAVVALSRSGTTTEVVDLVESLAAQSLPVVAITADPTSPLATVADEAVVVSYAAEESVVQTRFATSALALLRSALGEDLTPAITDAEFALAAELPGAVPRQVTFLGVGWSVGVAQEAALKCREAAGMWAEAYPAMEYRHGPISIADHDTLVWALAPLPPGLDAQIAATGAQLVTTSLDPLAELVRVQRFAVAAAVAAGRDPDWPRHLTYSVVL